MQQYNDISIDVLLQKNSKEEQRWGFRRVKSKS